jgi:hypothetical protein
MRSHHAGGHATRDRPKRGFTGHQTRAARYRAVPSDESATDLEIPGPAGDYERKWLSFVTDRLLYSNGAVLYSTVLPTEWPMSDTGNLEPS